MLKSSHDVPGVRQIRGLRSCPQSTGPSRTHEDRISNARSEFSGRGQHQRSAFAVDLKDGSLYTEQQTITPILDARGRANHFIAIKHDASDRKCEKAVWQGSEAKFRRRFEHVLEGAYQVAPDGRILTANPALIRMLGYSTEEELLGLEFARDIYLTADARNVFLRMLESAGEVRDFETALRSKNGRSVDVLENAWAVQDEQGVVLYYGGTLTDITDRKEREKQFEQAKKLEIVGRLAGGVAHDFNNVLTTILGYCELVLEDIGEEHRLRSDIETIQDAAQHAAGLTRQLLAFSRKQVLQPRVLDLNAIVMHVSHMLGRVLGEDIDLSTSLEPALWAVEADAGQLDQVLMNLALNARDAMSEGGKLTIGTANSALDKRYASEHPDVTAGQYVLLSVSDTGAGMSPYTLSHIFEPFFTTKEPGKGTGLGLATVHGIVKQSGGHISVQSESGRGTMFRIYLPRVEKPVEMIEPGVAGTQPLSGSETILLAEDEDRVRELVCRLLERLGYRVLVARTSDEVLQLAEQHQGAIHLLVTDVVMPEMSGCALADRVSLGHPEIKILYMSGHSSNAVADHGVVRAGMTLLEKPFTPLVLARKVRDALERS